MIFQNHLSPAVAQSEAEADEAVMDKRSFEVLYQTTARPLWTYIHRLCGNAALSDDILQETYFRFLNAQIRTVDIERLRPYLFRIATNLVTDHWRKFRREYSMPADEVPTKSVPALDVEADLRTDLRRGLDQLRPRDRALLWLAYGEGQAHREIADKLGLKEGSIKVLLYRARKKFSAILRRNGYRVAGNSGAQS